jgi:transposase
VTSTRATLPAEIDARQTALAAERTARQQAETRAASAEALVAHYKLLIAKLKRERFGQSSERGRTLLDQREWPREELAASAAEDKAAAVERSGYGVGSFPRRKPVRAPFPAHLPRERIVIPAPTACPCCGGKRAKLGETLTETLAVVPRQWGNGAMEADPDRARDVPLPVMRDDHPAAGALPCHSTRPSRAEPVGDDP